MAPIQAEFTEYASKSDDKIHCSLFYSKVLRNRYGRRINPDLITDAQIKPVVDLIAKVLEQKPDMISASVPLDQVDEIVQAVSAAAVALNSAGAGAYPREWTILVYQAR